MKDFHSVESDENWLVGAHLRETRVFTPIQIPLHDRCRVDRTRLKWFRKLWLGQPSYLDAADVPR
jgi:hypothetical protein